MYKQFTNKQARISTGSTIVNAFLADIDFKTAMTAKKSPDFKVVKIHKKSVDLQEKFTKAVEKINHKKRMLYSVKKSQNPVDVFQQDFNKNGGKINTDLLEKAALFICNAVTKKLKSVFVTPTKNDGVTEYHAFKCYKGVNSGKFKKMLALSASINRDYNLLKSQNIDDTTDDGGDLLQVTIIAILEACKGKNKIDLQGVQTVKDLNKKIFTADNDDLKIVTKKYKQVQLIYKAVRGYIESSSRTAINGNNCYLYLQDIVKKVDDDGNIIDFDIYRRCKWATLASPARDFNGAEISQTVSVSDVEFISQTIEKLGLTSQQQKVLDLRLQGLSLAEIAEKMNITRSGVQKHLYFVQQKAKKIGFIPKNK